MAGKQSPSKSETEKKTAEKTPDHYSHVKTLLAWDAPGRPFHKRDRSYYATSLLIMLFIEIILFLFSQYMLMLVVLSFVFIAFALASTPPHNFHYRISTEGIFVEDHFFIWPELYDFYFLKTNLQEVLHIRTNSLYPGELTITLGDMDTDHVRSILLPYLPYREYIKPTFIEKSSNWITKSFPLEGPKKTKHTKVAS